MTTVAGSRSLSKKRAKAAPAENVKSGVNSFPTRPRMSYALIILSSDSLFIYHNFMMAEL